MQACLHARETGDISRDVYLRTISTELVRSFVPVPHYRFDGESSSRQPSGQPSTLAAHKFGVNAIAIDGYWGKLLLSGGADGSVRIWDLESDSGIPHEPHAFRPTATAPRVEAQVRPAAIHAVPLQGHSRGVTHVGFGPRNADSFLTSSFDRTLQAWSTARARPAATFSLDATVHSHAVSRVASDQLVACATQHASVRLVDLRTRVAVHQLAGGEGPVLAAAWSPDEEHILASGHADGAVRIWDVRASAPLVNTLDKHDPLGIVHRAEQAAAAGAASLEPPFKPSARAHADAVNALAWTDDGRHIVSGGLDRQVRVWNAHTGANTLTSFGSLIRNRHARRQSMVISPSLLAVSGSSEVLFWPNEHEILALDLHRGSPIARLRHPGLPTVAPARGRGGGGGGGGRGGAALPARQGPPPGITSIAWHGCGARGRRGPAHMGGRNALGGIYAACADGQIRAWVPQFPGPDAEREGMEAEEEEDPDKMQKRKALDDAYNSLMRKKITFT